MLKEQVPQFCTCIFELIRRSNASIVTENKFEKSRKGRGVHKILLANGKIAEVIFSTLLSIGVEVHQPQCRY